MSGVFVPAGTVSAEVVLTTARSRALRTSIAALNREKLKVDFGGSMIRTFRVTAVGDHMRWYFAYADFDRKDCNAPCGVCTYDGQKVSGNDLPPMIVAALDALE